MYSSILNRRMFFAVLTIFIFVFAIQSMDPAAATKTKLVSKGSNHIYSASGHEWKYDWKIYTKGKNIAIWKVHLYCITHHQTAYMTSYNKKVSKTKVKIKTTINGQVSNYYKKSKLSALNFVKKENKDMIKSLHN